ncbi:iron-containing redox enzyme family protein [Streptomyces sp. URMC 123]|uniref:iron-containing redox enzyme family protein n=1 Tax=Streptomyces sp. URMC 123 TaxID=3423403 RepID=UPI003F1E2B3E
MNAQEGNAQEGNAQRGFALPDVMTSLPRGPHAVTPGAAAETERLLAAPPAEIYHRLLRDQESETTLLLARHLLEAFLARGAEEAAARGAGGDTGTDVTAESLAALVTAARAELDEPLAALCATAPGTRERVLSQRAPLTLLAGCWLDTVSQPATQPSVVVNRLFGHHFRLMGEDVPHRGLLPRRRRALEDLGVHLPAVESADFLTKAGARPLTAWHGAFHLALSRLPASFLPEVVGVHYATHALGVDDRLTGMAPFLPEADLQGLLAEYVALTRESPTGAEDRARLLAAVTLVLRLEREHTAALTELAARLDGLSLDARVAEIVARHAPFAGRQHRDVRLGERSLMEWLDDPEADLAAFVAAFRASRQFKPMRAGGCRFLRAIKFGGPMFGIFDEREAATFTEWAEAIAAGAPPELDFRPDTSGDAAARGWYEAVRATRAADVRLTGPGTPDDRELFHRVVNIERFPNTLELARERAEEGLAAAEVLFRHGADGDFTDATYFDYSAEALMERVDRVYWDKLVGAVEPPAEIPDREEVIFRQKTYALGSLIDGAWSHRTANLGRFHRRSDAMLFSIYADEMGRGDLAKNHITLIHNVLASMDVVLPHIRQEEFLDQDELPDGGYDFSIHQACLALFPDSFYNEILGYNLGIEMFGLGQLRMTEIRKLRRHGFDVSYEEAHLSIDNFSAGHARQAAEIIVSYLDEVRRDFGDAVVQDEWRRVWRGYASFAYFVERRLVGELRAKGLTGRSAAPASTDSGGGPGNDSGCGPDGDSDRADSVALVI